MKIDLNRPRTICEFVEMRDLFKTIKTHVFKIVYACIYLACIIFIFVKQQPHYLVVAHIQYLLNNILKRFLDEV